MLRAWLSILIFIVLMKGASAQAPEPLPIEPHKTHRANIVLILVDDAALMDFGAYGGEARTPHIDALAARGAVFTQYRTSPLCSPSRAMLLTGLDNHRTGISTIPEVIPDEHIGQPGYSLALEPGVLTLADRLQEAGYTTLMSGKWHMGSGPGELPSDHGFMRSLALDASGADNWRDKSYIPYYADAPWYEDGKPVDLPERFYSSALIIDKMIDYLKDADPEKPFFAYLPFQAIHIPVQAPPEFTAHYDGVYDQGWHALRTARHAKAETLGLIPEGVPLAPMPAGSRRWEALSDEDRALYAARMQVNAAMLEAMDHHIGRLIDHLKTAGLYESTLFVVTSDNGPEPSRGDNDGRLGLWLRFNGYHLGLDGIGEDGSWGFIGPEWANAAASPGALYKFYASEGGVRVPFIMAGPTLSQKQVTSPAMVTDVAPTLLDLVGLKTPPRPGSVPMTGRSLKPVLIGDVESAYGTNDIRAIEVSGNAALYKGDYKITRSMPPVGDGVWRLYHLTRDPGETQDLATKAPEKLAELLTDYADYTATFGALEMPEGYNSLQQIARNTQKVLTQQYGASLALIGLGLLALIIGLVIWRWRASSKHLGA